MFEPWFDPEARNFLVSFITLKNSGISPLWLVYECSSREDTQTVIDR